MVPRYDARGGPIFGWDRLAPMPRIIMDVDPSYSELLPLVVEMGQTYLSSSVTYLNFSEIASKSKIDSANIVRPSKIDQLVKHIFDRVFL
mgnify:CR=1 FL=1